MAKVTLHPILLEIHGKLGTHVYRRTSSGGTSIIRRADMSNVKWSEAQKAQRQRFKEAVAYAKAALADPEARAHYQTEAARLNKTAYNLALSDYFKGILLLQK